MDCGGLLCDKSSAKETALSSSCLALNQDIELLRTQG